MNIRKYILLFLVLLAIAAIFIFDEQYYPFIVVTIIILVIATTIYQNIMFTRRNIPGAAGLRENYKSQLVATLFYTISIGLLLLPGRVSISDKLIIGCMGLQAILAVFVYFRNKKYQPATIMLNGTELVQNAEVYTKKSVRDLQRIKLNNLATRIQFCFSDGSKISIDKSDYTHAETWQFIQQVAAAGNQVIVEPDVEVLLCANLHGYSPPA